MTEFFFSAGEVSFHRAERPVEDLGGLAVGEALLKMEVEGEPFSGRKLFQGVGEVVIEIQLLRRGRFGGFSRVDVGQSGASPVVAAGVAPMIIRHPQQPRGEERATSKTIQRAPRGHERLLGEIVRRGDVSSSQATQEVPHGGLMALHKEPEGRGVLMPESAGDQIGIAHRGEAGCSGDFFRVKISTSTA